MRHFQYRIRERVRHNGQKYYIVQWRDDWFGTGIFWFSTWYRYTCTRRKDISQFFHDIEFPTLEDARDFLTLRMKADAQQELGKIKCERTVK